MSDTATRALIKALLKNGRLKSGGTLTLDGDVVYAPEAQSGVPDEFGFLPPETDFGGQQNEKVNELRDEWLNSDDKLKVKVAKETPYLFVVVTDAYKPDAGSEEMARLIHNNGKGWPFNVGMILDFVDTKDNIIDGHLFYAMGNYLIGDSDERDKMLNDIADRYERYINYIYANYRRSSPK